MNGFRLDVASVMPSASAWRRLAPLLLLMAAVLLLFRDTTEAMVGIWIRSDTFAHAFLVPPIVLWLVWRRRAELARLQPRPAPWFLLPIAAVCALWLLGELASVNSATQFALVALLVLSVPAVFGTAVARALTFPLLFLFFAVPFGEFMVPHMMEWTANFTIAAVRASGVPVYREGLQFIIPSGSWSVIEACSGVRYLIASFMVGTLFAYLNFQTAWKRAAFIVLSLGVPIVANWLRAYLIVMLGHLSNNKLAAGVDHIIYGWVFFGIVIGTMFWIGAHYAEPDPSLPAAAADHPRAAAAIPLQPTLAVGAGMLLLLLLTQAAFWELEHDADRGTPALALPVTLAGGYAEVPQTSNWVPGWQDPSTIATRSYADRAEPAAPAVSLWIGYYRDQGYARKLVSSSNLLAEGPAESGAAEAAGAAQQHTAVWAQTDAGATQVDTAAGPVAWRTAQLRGSIDPGANSAPRLRAWQLYWVGGHLSTSDAEAKLRIAGNRLLGRGDDSAVVIVYTALPPTDATGAVAAADVRLQHFVASQMSMIEQVLQSAQSAQSAQAAKTASGNPH